MANGEGGGNHPPFKESFLETIVGVNWAPAFGGVFVSGDFCCYQRAIRIEKDGSSEGWVGLSSLAFGDGGGTFASTYGNVKGVPTFLIGGHGSGGGGSGAVLMRSNDGFKWENMGAARFMGSDIVGLVWDGNATEKNIDGQVTISGGGLFYAHTRGASVSEADRNLYSPDGELWYYAYDDFASHCKLIPGVPDGIFGYNPRSGTVIFPGESSYPNIGDIFYRPNDLPYDNNVIYIMRGDSVEAMTLSGTVDDIFWQMTDHIAVAYVGGVWMVGGGGFIGTEAASSGERGNTSMTVSSIDDGYSWFLSTYGQLDNNSDFFVETMIGAPIRDFK